jgi:hypothetical protein
MKRNFFPMVPVLLLCMAAAAVFAGTGKTVEKTFSNVKRIKIKLVLGSCEIKKSKDSNVYVRVEYTYKDDDFEARFRETGTSVEMSEKFHDGDNDGGSSNWTLLVPEGINIDFNSATGSLVLEGFQGDIDANTGTGDYEIKDSKGQIELNSGTGELEINDCEGDFDLNSGTGDVILENCTGDFDANSGTGDVEGSNLTIASDCSFNSGTGDATVIAPKGDQFDLTVSSGTGDALLDMKGAPLKGSFEFEANKRKGRIICSEKFDIEEEYEEGGSTILKKSFSKGAEPCYSIHTGTGKAELKK